MIMTDMFIVCCKKLPPIKRICISIMGGSYFIYIRSLLRTSAHWSLRLDLLVLEILEVSITLLRRGLSPETEHDAGEVS